MDGIGLAAQNGVVFADLYMPDSDRIGSQRVTFLVADAVGMVNDQKHTLFGIDFGTAYCMSCFQMRLLVAWTRIAIADIPFQLAEDQKHIFGAAWNCNPGRRSLAMPSQQSSYQMDLSLSEDWFAGGDMGWEGSLTAE